MVTKEVGGTGYIHFSCEGKKCPIGGPKIPRGERERKKEGPISYFRRLLKRSREPGPL